MTLPALTSRPGRTARRDASHPAFGPDVLGRLERMTEELNSYLDAWHDLPDDAFRPLADVEETPDAYAIEIELPGVRRDDIDIEVSGRRVSVNGQRRDKERVGFLRRRERVVGRFAYEVTLPGDVDDEHVDARLDDGVLTIQLPKPDRDRPRRIALG